MDGVYNGGLMKMTICFKSVYISHYALATKFHQEIENDCQTKQCWKHRISLNVGRFDYWLCRAAFHSPPKLHHKRSYFRVSSDIVFAYFALLWYVYI